MNPVQPVFLTLFRRVNRTVLAVVSADGVYDVWRGYAPDAKRLATRARRLATAYGASVLVTEEGDDRSDVVNHLALPTKAISLADTKARLCGSSKSTHAQLIAAVIEARPELRHVVAGARLSGVAAQSHRWRMVLILAIALGLAHCATDP